VFCGDLNSRPLGVTHSYLSRGFINAKRIAPWYYNQYSSALLERDDNNNNRNNEDEIVDEMGKLTLSNEEFSNEKEPSFPKIRYILDATLNKLCRWLRILGIDTALETEEEERIRTATDKKDRRMIIFERCRDEQRTLVTTSTRLLQRRDCPSSAYCINPVYLPSLEVALVHMLTTHGVVLEPRSFLSRCGVCNGNILPVDDRAQAKAILEEYLAPDVLLHESGSMEVNKCDGCGQGYWWCDLPTSSASRVKNAATRLLELCIRAGIPLVDENDLGMFGHISVEELRKEGWDHNTYNDGSELLRQKLCVIDWLKNEHLECPFDLVSVYATKEKDADCGEPILGGEVLPFTNVTSSFVDTLDYIFFDKKHAVLTERLYVPTSFAELNPQGIGNGHLLPSNVWPSDHLAIGARLSFSSSEPPSSSSPVPPKEEQMAAAGASVEQLFCLPTTAAEASEEQLFCLPTNTVVSTVVSPSQLSPGFHDRRCGCGCVPPILSLFEMAELRRQAKLKAQTGV
jgi:uncharacterized protein with PIN domain